MAVAPTFDPQAAPGELVRNTVALMDRRQSMMERATQSRQLEQMREMQMAEQRLMQPVKAAEVQAALAKAKTEYAGAIQTQEARASAYSMLDKARADFDFVNKIEDARARAQASREWLSRYSQLANVKELSGEIGSYNDLAARNIADSAKLAMLIGTEERFWNSLTSGFTPDERAKAAKVKTGVEARPSSAAIVYREVEGPDGTPQLVAVDPRNVGAQVIGTGQTYGSGVNRTKESEAFERGEELARENVFRGQSTEAETASKESARIKEERKAALPKRKAALERVEIATDRLIEDIDQAISQVNTLTAGPGGTILGAFPGTSARDLQSTLDTVVANVGFEALSAMREASKTGGALGNVTERELELLQAILASLKVGQSPTQLISNLKKARNRIAENAGAARRAFGQEYGDEGGPDLSSMSDEQLEARLRELRGAK